MLRISVILAILLMVSCSRKKEAIPPLPDLNMTRTKPVIYQMMTRLFGNKKAVNNPYGTLAENGVGKFADITDAALQGIKELGVTHVWYTGIIEHAVLTDYTAFGIPLDDADVVKGRAGSPYAIKDYYDVNPDLANEINNRMGEFEALVQRTHGNGLKVIIDFVPNHVARAYRSDARPQGVRDLGEDDDKTARFSPSNNFYYLPGESFVVPKDYVPLGSEFPFPTKDGKFDEYPAKVTGNDKFTASPGVNEWFETVKLNYGVDVEGGGVKHFNPVPDTWIKMRDILIFWANKKVDGFRCDMAEMVPVEFWQWVIPQVKAINPALIFIAEIYNPAQYRNYIQTGRFDFLYDKVQLYDTLRLLITNKSKATAVAEIQESLKDIGSHMLHFLENHDEQRIASRFFAGDPWKAIPAMVISATIDPGPVMIYFGQEVGEPGAGSEGFQGDDGRTTIFDYWGVPEHQKWMNGGKFDGALLSENQQSLRTYYKSLLTFSATSSAITTGDYYDVTAFNISLKSIEDDIVCYLRAKDKDRILVVAGFNKSARRIKISLQPELASKLNILPGRKYLMKNQVGESLEFEMEGLSIALDLPPHGALVLSITEL